MTVDLTKLKVGDHVRFTFGEIYQVDFISGPDCDGEYLISLKGAGVSHYSQMGADHVDSDYNIVEIIPDIPAQESIPTMSHKELTIASGEPLMDLEPGEYKLTVKPKPVPVGYLMLLNSISIGEYYHLADNKMHVEFYRDTGKLLAVREIPLDLVPGEGMEK